MLEGDIDRALGTTEENFPSVLIEHRQVKFRLNCRKWIELFSKAADYRRQAERTQKQRAQNDGGFASKDSAVEDDVAHDMELDDQPYEASSQALEGAQPEQYDKSHYNTLLDKAMIWGQTLQREYRDEPNEEWNKTLRDMFSLVAYENPHDSVHGSLLDRKGRVAVADELNSAILGKLPLTAIASGADLLTFF